MTWFDEERIELYISNVIGSAATRSTCWCGTLPTIVVEKLLPPKHIIQASGGSWILMSYYKICAVLYSMSIDRIGCLQ